MLFHLGSIWRLLQLEYLENVDRVSSVSGGSITAAKLAIAWKAIFESGIDVEKRFKRLVVEPIRGVASKTIDRSAILKGVFWFGSVSDRVVTQYRKQLFDKQTLQDLPSTPRFVINATSVQSGVLFRLSRPYLWDYKVGRVDDPDLSVAEAVAASSAFPPLLSPLVLRMESDRFVPGSGNLDRTDLQQSIFLTDGGVYDNLGLESAKDFETILVSDGGGQISPKVRPARNWAWQSIRILEIIDSQVRSLRKRALIEDYVTGRRDGTFWSIRSDVADYGPPQGSLPCTRDRTLKLAGVSTRLKAMDDTLQERLINWGYAMCDVAMRKWVNPGLPQPVAFPYPKSAI